MREKEPFSLKGKKIIIPDKSVVWAEDELLPLCTMCIKSRLTCDNYLARMTIVPLEEDDDPEKGIIFRRLEDDSLVAENSGFKMVDGVNAGIFKAEEDIPIPFVCAWFEPKPAG